MAPPAKNGTKMYAYRRQDDALQATLQQPMGTQKQQAESKDCDGLLDDAAGPKQQRGEEESRQHGSPTQDQRHMISQHEVDGYLSKPGGQPHQQTGAKDRLSCRHLNHPR